MRELVIGSVTLVLALAASPASAQTSGVRLINEDQAKSCNFIDTQITAAPGKLSDFGKWDQAADGVEQRLRASATERAIKANGNAIVYRSIGSSGTLPMLMFDIYRCPSQNP
jgi:hypothetical protein